MRTRIKRTVTTPARPVSHSYEVTVRLKGGVVLRGIQHTEKEAEALRRALVDRADELEAAFKVLAAANAERRVAEREFEKKARVAHREQDKVWDLLSVPGSGSCGVNYSWPKPKPKKAKKGKRA